MTSWFLHLAQLGGVREFCPWPRSPIRWPWGDERSMSEKLLASMGSDVHRAQGRRRRVYRGARPRCDNRLPDKKRGVSEIADCSERSVRRISAASAAAAAAVARRVVGARTGTPVYDFPRRDWS